MGADDGLTDLDAGQADGPVCEAIMAELVKLRKRRKIGQAPLAQAIGMSQARVSQIENMVGGVSLESVVLYARAIGATVVVVPDKGPKRGRSLDADSEV